jgi:hypothetical protein
MKFTCGGGGGGGGGGVLFSTSKFSLCDSDRRIDLCSSIEREDIGLNKQINMKKVKIIILLSFQYIR